MQAIDQGHVQNHMSCLVESIAKRKSLKDDDLHGSMRDVTDVVDISRTRCRANTSPTLLLSNDCGVISRPLQRKRSKQRHSKQAALQNTILEHMLQQGDVDGNGLTKAVTTGALHLALVDNGCRQRLDGHGFEPPLSRSKCLHSSSTRIGSIDKHTWKRWVVYTSSIKSNDNIRPPCCTRRFACALRFWEE